mgnify:CR=1 FL=1
MSLNTVIRTLAALLSLATGLIHLVLLNVLFMRNTGSPLPDIPFTLNGLGFLVLAALLLLQPARRARLNRALPLILAAYSALTIALWAVLNGDFTDPVGLVTKLIETVLVLTSLAVFFTHPATPTEAP